MPLILSCTCVGIHPGRVEPASPIELTTSRTEALQARRSCASSPETFTQSFLHRAWPKTSGPERGLRSALIVVAHIFSWPPVRLHHVRGGVSRRFLISPQCYHICLRAFHCRLRENWHRDCYSVRPFYLPILIITWGVLLKVRRSEARRVLLSTSLHQEWQSFTLFFRRNAFTFLLNPGIRYSWLERPTISVCVFYHPCESVQVSQRLYCRQKPLQTSTVFEKKVTVNGQWMLNHTYYGRYRKSCPTTKCTFRVHFQALI